MYLGRISRPSKEALNLRGALNLSGGALCLGGGEIKLFWMAYTIYPNLGSLQQQSSSNFIPKFHCAPPISPPQIAIFVRNGGFLVKNCFIHQNFCACFLRCTSGGRCIGGGLYTWAAMPNLLGCLICGGWVTSNHALDTTQAQAVAHVLTNRIPWGPHVPCHVIDLPWHHGFGFRVWHKCVHYVCFLLAFAVESWKRNEAGKKGKKKHGK